MRSVRHVTKQLRHNQHIGAAIAAAIAERAAAAATPPGARPLKELLDKSLLDLPPLEPLESALSLPLLSLLCGPERTSAKIESE